MEESQGEWTTFESPSDPERQVGMNVIINIEDMKVRLVWWPNGSPPFEAVAMFCKAIRKAFPLSMADYMKRIDEIVAANVIEHCYIALCRATSPMQASLREAMEKQSLDE